MPKTFEQSFRNSKTGKTSSAEVTVATDLPRSESGPPPGRGESLSDSLETVSDEVQAGLPWGAKPLIYSGVIFADESMAITRRWQPHSSEYVEFDHISFRIAHHSLSLIKVIYQHIFNIGFQIYCQV